MSITWRDKAACLDADPEIFYIPGGRDTPHPHAEKANAYCRVCPVAEACWNDAAANRDVDVFRAGREIRKPIPVCAQCGVIFTPPKRKGSIKFCTDAHRDLFNAALAEKAAAAEAAREANARYLACRDAGVCSNGHALTEETITRSHPAGRKSPREQCRVCRRNRNRGVPLDTPAEQVAA